MRYTFLILLIVISGKILAQNSDLLHRFQHPPVSTKPWVYWYWISGHITKEGITKDLEAMRKAGIGTAFIANVNDEAIKAGEVKVLSEQWWGYMEHAIREGGRTGVNIGVFNCPGWSMSGGPWVTADKTMRYLSSTEKKVRGGQPVQIQFDNAGLDFQQIAVLAFPTLENDSHTINTSIKQLSSTPQIADASNMFDSDKNTTVLIKNYPVTFEISLSKPETIRSVKLFPSDIPMNAYFEIQYLDFNNYWRTICRKKIDRQLIQYNAGPIKFGAVSESFNAIKSKKIRIIFTEGGSLLPWIKLTNNKALGCISEIELSSKAILPEYIEKQLGKLAPTPFINWETYMWPQSAEPEHNNLIIDASNVLNITDKVDSIGFLRWNAPAGNWTVMRAGMVPTGSKNHPVTKECEGFEIDKMSKAHTRYHFDSFVGKLLRRMPVKDRKALTHVVMDSYEQGPQNWTDDMTERFKAAYGYDPMPWLPVLTGRIVDSAEKSDRFLWDLRRLVANLIATEYIAGMREKANQHDLRLWCENYGFGFPGESLMYGGASDEVAGEFWNTMNEVGNSECRIASSCANVYGKKTVSAESFTSHQSFANMPRDFKVLGDWIFTQGINHMVLHVNIHQPNDNTPGVNAWFGSDFNRNSTWFIKAKPYYDYIQRSCALLQAGVHQADILYYYGEDAPKQSVDLNPAPPAGTDYDIINAEVLLRDAYVKNGRIVLKSGINYAVLVLPNQSSMRPEVLQKISQLVNDGATVVGVRPTHSPSLANFPQADKQIKATADKLWGEIDGINITQNSYGKGNVFSGVLLEEVFSKINLKEDIVLPEMFSYIHRKEDNSDIYFVSNQTQKAFEGEIGFKITGMQPELWNAVTGEIKDLSEFSERNGYTFVPLKFNNTDSWFVVFRKNIAARIHNRNFPEYKTIQILEGEWTVSFNTALDAPQKTVFQTLTDWSTNANSTIKYYSGTATYSKSFEFTGDVSKTLSIDLGRVEKMASVRLNGKSLGTVWCYPYRVNINNALKKGKNTIEIDVTTPWWNRVVGDEQNNSNKKYTWTALSMNWMKNVGLQAAGLLGPVVLETSN
jgi:hypothetical protein